MIELELDFSEEDVEFASREQLKELVEKIQQVIRPLIDSFKLGNAIKKGVPIVIAGKPNAGKSTLLNALLNEEKAIVSDIPGTTRDFIEDEITIEGIRFRFIDTAGLRDTEDTIEAQGVARSLEQMRKASLIIYMVDLADNGIENVKQELQSVKESAFAPKSTAASADKQDQVPLIFVGNKVDKVSDKLRASLEDTDMVLLSALNKENLEALKSCILNAVRVDPVGKDQTLVTSLRHYESLSGAHGALSDVLDGIAQSVSNDLLALDIRTALHHLGEITGEITTEDLLENIFSKFCIGK